MEVFKVSDYLNLAKAVSKGMPMEEAEKILQKYRNGVSTGEEHFWLGLTANDEDKKTTIQLREKTKEELRSFRIAERETYESILSRLIKRESEVTDIFKEVTKLKLLSDNGTNEELKCSEEFYNGVLFFVEFFLDDQDIISIKEEVMSELAKA